LIFTSQLTSLLLAGLFTYASKRRGWKKFSINDKLTLFLGISCFVFTSIVSANGWASLFDRTNLVVGNPASSTTNGTADNPLSSAPTGACVFQGYLVTFWFTELMMSATVLTFALHMQIVREHKARKVRGCFSQTPIYKLS